MDYETYDPEKHELKTSQTGRCSTTWRDRLEAAVAASPNGIIVRGISHKAVSTAKNRYGYQARTRNLKDGSGFVLWAEKIQ